MYKLRTITLPLIGISISIIAMLALSDIALSQTQKNPYTGNPQAIKEGAEIFKRHCESCHGPGGRGDICPDLTKKTKKYGNSDADLFLTISRGRPGGMPNWGNTLSQDKIWKVITYIRSIEK